MQKGGLMSPEKNPPRCSWWKARLEIFKFSVKHTSENKSMKERMNAILKGFATDWMSVSIGIDIGVFEHGENTFCPRIKVDCLNTFFNGRIA